MKETTRQHETNNLLFYTVAIVIIIISFFLFVPKVASDLFPFKRQLLWNNFLAMTKKDQHMDARKFWELREFYSSGYFTRNNSASTNEITTAIKPYEVTITAPLTTLLSFKSATIMSIDSLTTESQLRRSISTLPKKNILFQDSNTIIYKLDNHHVIISFIKSIDEMKRADGFFEYADKDKKIVENKYWFDITKITIP